MTIKNIGLSIATVAVLGTASFAGTVSNSGSVGLIGSEALSLADVNVSTVFSGIKYEPTDIPATSVKNPIFKFTFGNAKDIKAGNNVVIYETDDANTSNISNWKLVANNPQISGANSEVVSFSAINGSIYAHNNKVYVIKDLNATSDADVNVTVTKGSTSDLTLSTVLYSGDSQLPVDRANTTSIAKVGPEYVGSVTQKFDATIDASNSFYIFYNLNSDGATKKADNAIFNLHQKATLTGASLKATQANLDLTFDQNLTANGYVESTGASTTANDTNVTDVIVGAFNAANSLQDNNETLTLTVNGSSVINKTNFTAHAYVTDPSDATKTFDLITKLAGNAGAWTIYGYNAQIPNVAGLVGSYKTVMKFTNRSNLDTNIYFTLIDPAGHIATLNSKDDQGIVSLPKNTTGKYLASDLATLAHTENPNFDGSRSFSVEVSIPTTPNSVYGSASFINNVSGQYKDLPVYNSSTMDY